MAMERTAAEIAEALYAQAAYVWGEEDAEGQRQALAQAAEEIVSMARYALPPDLEPRFF